MRQAHLLSGVLAIVVLVAALAGGTVYANVVESDFVHALATATFQQKNQGTALQAKAVRQSDLLLLFGSSEVGAGGPYTPAEFFRHYPTGFTVFPVAKGGLTSLLYMQSLAALGPEVRGKKVVISYTPSSFLMPMASQEFVAGNFSQLHAQDTAFNSQLSLTLRQAAAKRMLDYPSTLAKDPLFSSALQALVDGSPAGWVSYYALRPLLETSNLVLNLQDHWETLAYIQGRNGRFNAVTRQPADLDWSTLARRALEEQRKLSTNNDLGFDNGNWAFNAASVLRQKNSVTDAQFVSRMEQSAEWGDLDLLLQAVRELGADAEIVCLPLNGAYYDFVGVSRAAREVFYQKLTQAGARYGVPVVTFSDHDGDPYFVVDQYSHPSREGMVYYDQALDAFYHRQLH